MFERMSWGKRVSMFVLATGLASLPAAALGQDEAAPPDSASLSSEPDVLNGLSSATSGRVGGATLRSYGADIAAGPVPRDAKESSAPRVSFQVLVVLIAPRFGDITAADGLAGLSIMIDDRVYITRQA